MSKPDQILRIEPATELKFVGPFSSVVTSELKLTNPSGKKVAFKVKTTAPKRYCVRPNSGLIEPNGQVVVSVMLQPFEYDPTEKNNHKFMVQSLSAPTATVETLDQLWKDTVAGQLMDSKLKCVFEMPALDEPLQQQNILDVTSDDDNTKAALMKSVQATAAASAEKAPAKMTGGGAGGVDEEVKRVQAECRYLSSEIQRLQEDNRKLREEGIRLRKVASGTASYPTSSSPAQHSSSMTSAPVSVDASAFASQPPIAYLIAMLVLGIIVGKFLL